MHRRRSARRSVQPVPRPDGRVKHRGNHRLHPPHRGCKRRIYDGENDYFDQQSPVLGDKALASTALCWQAHTKAHWQTPTVRFCWKV